MSDRDMAPIPMLLWCPRCGFQHVDTPQPEKGWTNPPHRSHECQACGYVWRPSDWATTGVTTIATRGQRDNVAAPIVGHVAQGFRATLDNVARCTHCRTCAQAARDTLSLLNNNTTEPSKAVRRYTMRWLPFLLVFCSCSTDAAPTLEGDWAIHQIPGAGDCGMVEANQGITFTLVDGAPTAGIYNVEYPPADDLYVQPIVFDPADETFQVTLVASFEVDANHVTTDVAELVFDGDTIRGGGEIIFTQTDPPVALCSQTYAAGGGR